MPNEITLPFILYVNDYHEFIHIEKFLHALNIECGYRQLDDEPYHAVFYAPDEYPENLIGVRTIKL